MKKFILLVPTITMFCSLFLSQSFAEVTLSVGNSSALPGSTDISLVVSLENQSNQIKGVQMDICDTDNLLACTGCETTERTTAFNCSSNELENGCCRVLLFDFSGGVIAEGDGPVFTLTYDVSGEAPAEKCRDLSTEEIRIRDENTDILEATSVAGEFCFDDSLPPSTTSIRPGPVPTSTTTTPLTTTSSVPSTTSTTIQTAPGTTTTKPGACLLREIYGNDSEETELLRYVRDNVLSQFPEGRELIRLYYQWSPLMVKLIEDDEDFKEYVKEIIYELMLSMLEE